MERLVGRGFWCCGSTERGHEVWKPFVQELADSAHPAPATLDSRERFLFLVVAAVLAGCDQLL